MKIDKDEFYSEIFDMHFKPKQEFLQIPIVDGNNKLLGTFTERDLFAIPLDDKQVFDREVTTPANKEKYFSVL